MNELGPVLAYVNEDFEQLEAEFQSIKAQIDQTNADIDGFFALLDKRRAAQLYEPYEHRASQVYSHSAVP